MPYSNTWLIHQLNQHEQVKYLFFWGHQPAKDGSITSSCLSQWWPARFEVDGNSFATAEHWMMAEKAGLFKDEEVKQQIIRAASPAEVKKLGRLVQGFEPAIWEEHKYDIVVRGNYHKFSQDPALTDFLLNTGDAVIVEASPVDAIWGIGLAADDPRVMNPLVWRGENLLGYALMEVRDQLKQL